MGDEATPQDPRQEYASLLGAVRAWIELEQSFGIENWKLPPARDAASRKPQATGQELRATSTQHPASSIQHPVSSTQHPEPATRVVTHHSVGMFAAEDYNVEIPEGLSRQEQLDTLARHMADCTLCPLHQGRTQVVFGAGNPDADLMFIGEAPGRDEDEQGIPFIGRAGQLLTKIIQAIEFTRDDVYITNINKCRPPNNRAPMPDEMARCMPFLLRQIKIIEPKVICLLGATAVRGLLQVNEGITRLRGKFMEWNGILVMPTYHPAYLLRNPAAKRDVWEDVQKVRDKVRGA